MAYRPQASGASAPRESHPRSSAREVGAPAVRRSWHGPWPAPGPDDAAGWYADPARRDPAEGRPRLARGLAGHARDPAPVRRASGRYLAGAADGGREMAACLPDPARRARLPLAPAPSVIRRRIVDRDGRHALGGRLVPARPGGGLGGRARDGGDRRPAGPLPRHRPPDRGHRAAPGRAPAGRRARDTAVITAGSSAGRL